VALVNTTVVQNEDLLRGWEGKGIAHDRFVADDAGRVRVEHALELLCGVLDAGDGQHDLLLARVFAPHRADLLCRVLARSKERPRVDCGQAELAGGRRVDGKCSRKDGRGRRECRLGAYDLHDADAGGADRHAGKNQLRQTLGDREPGRRVHCDCVFGHVGHGDGHFDCVVVRLRVVHEEGNAVAVRTAQRKAVQ